MRLVNAAIALVTLASAAAVLWSDVFVAGYREHYRDALWFVAAYATVQAYMLVAFLRPATPVRGLVLLKTGVAYAFLVGFLALWPQWRFWTPARYVYQLFAWDDRSAIGLFALVFLGRGAFNTLNAVYFGRSSLLTVRVKYPLAGRVATALPAAITAACVWAFLALVHEEQTTFSPEARDVAREVLATLDCAALRAHLGETTRDLRQRGDRRYAVEITYGCPATRVLVHLEDGRTGSAAGDRPDCCDVTPPRS